MNENCEEEMRDLGAKNAVLAETYDELQLEIIQRNAEIELMKMEKNALEAQANERLREQELDMNGLEDQLRERDWTIVQMGRLCKCGSDGMQRLREVINSGTYQDLRNVEVLPNGT
ncbi:hypothetical protein QFC24_002482 [Naganishia onofrii]|uniref:Uncharacterized protein n=1 Tax=Naganishia onofrii TaxID=1851511 RepID=A0ACC2XQR5_9TREE|nr:hypothetical protein QFC24_002482 [Naganishia onofrii]